MRGNGSDAPAERCGFFGYTKWVCKKFGRYLIKTNDAGTAGMPAVNRAVFLDRSYTVGIRNSVICCTGLSNYYGTGNGNGSAVMMSSTANRDYSF